jgi:hypothetical protein
MRILERIIDDNPVVLMFYCLGKCAFSFSGVIHIYLEVLKNTPEDTDGIAVATEEQTAEHR